MHDMNNRIQKSQFKVFTKEGKVWRAHNIHTDDKENKLFFVRIHFTTYIVYETAVTFFFQILNKKCGNKTIVKWLLLVKRPITTLLSYSCNVKAQPLQVQPDPEEGNVRSIHLTKICTRLYQNCKRNLFTHYITEKKGWMSFHKP